MSRNSKKQQAASTGLARLLAGVGKRLEQPDDGERIELYWKVGEVISQRIERDGWGKGTVATLADEIRRTQPSARGFSPQNLWRMRQFFDAYRGTPELATLARRVSWSSNLHIIGKAKDAPEREFYLRMAARHGWQVREVARQIDAALFERKKTARSKAARQSRQR